MKTIDVADGVVDVRIVRDCVWSAVGQCQERIFARVADCGTEAAEFVRAYAVFERISEAREILEFAGARFVDRADGKKRNLCLSDRSGEESESGQAKHTT